MRTEAAHCRTEGAQHRLLDRTRVIFVTYRPLEVKRHPDGRALGDGVGVGAEDLSERGAVGARRLRVDDVLGMLETHAEKNLAVPGGGATDTAGAGEGVDLQLEDPGGESLRGEEEVLHRISADARKYSVDMLENAQTHAKSRNMHMCTVIAAKVRIKCDIVFLQKSKISMTPDSLHRTAH